MHIANVQIPSQILKKRDYKIKYQSSYLVDIK